MLWEQLLKLNDHHYLTSSSITFLHAVMGQALVRSGWMMLAVLGVNHVFSPAQTGELDLITVSILKTWPFPVLVLSPLLTAALSAQRVPLLSQPSSLQVIPEMCCHDMTIHVTHNIIMQLYVTI